MSFSARVRSRNLSQLASIFWAIGWAGREPGDTLSSTGLTSSSPVIRSSSRTIGKEETMGQPHEDLQTLYAMKGRLEETGEMARTLGLDNGGEAGNIYQALVQVSALVDNEIKATRNIVDPHENL
jgi:hypothetical protein